MNIMQKYGNDFTEHLEFKIWSFATEFKSDIIQKHERKDIVKILQDSHVISSFPQFHKLLILFLTIPVTVAAAERSFSKLKWIKTYLRFSMAYPVYQIWRLFLSKMKRQKQSTGMTWFLNLLHLTQDAKEDTRLRWSHLNFLHDWLFCFYFVWYDSIIFLIIWYFAYLDGNHILFTHLDSEIFAICWAFAFQPFLRYWNLRRFDFFKILIFYIHCFEGSIYLFRCF